MVWHLDVGQSFPKSVSSLIVGSADPSLGYIFGRFWDVDVKNRRLFTLCYTLNVKKYDTLADKSHFHTYYSAKDSFVI